MTFSKCKIKPSFTRAYQTCHWLNSGVVASAPTVDFVARSLGVPRMRGTRSAAAATKRVAHSDREALKVQLLGTHCVLIQNNDSSEHCSPSLIQRHHFC